MRRRGYWARFPIRKDGTRRLGWRWVPVASVRPRRRRREVEGLDE